MCRVNLNTTKEFVTKARGATLLSIFLDLSRMHDCNPSSSFPLYADRKPIVNIEASLGK
jgi:hypothetical protein